MPNTTLIRQPGAPVLRVGHRGARGHAPENTFASFNLAVEMGVSAVETDVHLSKDGAVVLIHDHTVDRTTDGRGFVKDMTLSQLKSLDAGKWYDPRFEGERIPELGEFLEWACEWDVAVALEIKNGPLYYPEIAAKLVHVLRKHDMLSRAIVISFDHPVLLEARQIEPDLTTGILYAARLADPAAAAHAAGASALHPHWAYVTPDLVQVAHDAGLAVSPWCPNDAPTIKRLADMGIDSIGTDYPELFDQI
jgi:glycerophosphoryl diester phosphodiesterase